MHSKIVFATLILSCFLVCVCIFQNVKKYYLSYNLLRFDPLEESKADPGLFNNHNDSNTIWLVGDSRIKHWNTSLLASSGYDILNLGVDGQTSSQVLNRLKNNFELGTPDLIILEVGINDLKIIGIDKGLTFRVVEGCVNNISAILDLCKAKNVNVILLNIFPTGNIEKLRRLVWNDTVEPQIGIVNERLKSYCINNNFLFFDTNELLCDKNLKIKKKYQNGFLHVNGDAYKALSENIIKEFGTIIN
jgi:lysophospholipase L1-like esterase